MVIFLFFFNKPEHAQFFLKYINEKHKNMKLLIDTKINDWLSFLDIKIFWGNEKLFIGVFREVSLVGYILIWIALFHLSTSLVLYTHYWIGVFIYLLNSGIYLLNKVLSKNTYPQNLTDKYVQKFQNNRFIQKPHIVTVPIKELIIILPYLEKM